MMNDDGNYDIYFHTRSPQMMLFVKFIFPQNEVNAFNCTLNVRNIRKIFISKRPKSLSQRVFDLGLL